MSCERCESLLNRLGDGDLNPLVAVRVRRHLARCAHCAAHFADIERINAAAGLLRGALLADGRAPASLSARVRRAVAENPSPAARASEVLGPVASTDDPHAADIQDPQSSVLARSHRRPVRTLTIAIAFAFAVALTVRLLPTRPAAAFPQVLQAVERIGFTHMRLSMQTDVDDHGHKMTVYDAYLRAAPPAFAMTLPGGVRLVGGRTGVRMFTGHGTPPIPLTSVPLTRSDIEKAMLSPDQLLRGRIGDSLAGWGPADTVRSADDGASEIRFRSDAAGMRRTLWVDPQTLRPRRLELSPAPAAAPVPLQSGPLYVMTIQFSYNDEPPPGTFDVPAQPSRSGAASPSRPSGK